MALVSKKETNGRVVGELFEWKDQHEILCGKRWKSLDTRLRKMDRKNSAMNADWIILRDWMLRVKWLGIVFGALVSVFTVIGTAVSLANFVMAHFS